MAVLGRKEAAVYAAAAEREPQQHYRQLTYVACIGK